MESALILYFPLFRTVTNKFLLSVSHLIYDIFDTEEKVGKYEDNNFSDNQENYNSNYKVNVFDWKKVLSVGVFLSVII